MPWITEKDQTFWLPETLPSEVDDNYKIDQQSKSYLTPENTVRIHPNWTFASNGALVTDEYLYQNEGWKLIVDEGPSMLPDDLKHGVKNSIAEWDHTDERIAKVTYTYTNFTSEEIDEYTSDKWEYVREIRDKLLAETDWIIIRATEENLTISQEILNYRTLLRNFPETIDNILEFDPENTLSWPVKPTVFFEA